MAINHTDYLHELEWLHAIYLYLLFSNKIWVHCSKCDATVPGVWLASQFVVRTKPFSTFNSVQLMKRRKNWSNNRNDAVYKKKNEHYFPSTYENIFEFKSNIDNLILNINLFDNKNSHTRALEQIFLVELSRHHDQFATSDNRCWLREQISSTDFKCMRCSFELRPLCLLFQP